MSDALYTECIAVKLDKETHAKIKEAAAAANQSMAAFLRTQLEIAVHIKEAPLLAPKRLEPWRAA